ncbi:hypothetical protein BC629DRAFT_1451400 [Irpex lacteus]|nr:hypothetical protein BC629DRAFT_1451400 [Irpex lacteus]
MSLIAPNNRPRGGGQGKGGPRRQQNNKLYSHPLPLLLVPPPRTRTSLVTSRVLGLCGFSSITVENPHCEGVLDRATKSVWVTNKKDAMILWRRGFFGKGDLSRSEPSWYTRQVNARKEAAASGGKSLTSEEIREKRRAERKQFKLDRARALAQAAEEAENAFKEGRQANVVAIPSGATWKPQQSSVAEHVQAVPEAFLEEEDEELKEEEPLEDVEHLQLTLQEAFFLIWNFDCLTVFDPSFDEALTLEHIWDACQEAHWPSLPPSSLEALYAYAGRFDNPFLVNYVAYHHYRSLGWVVKGGIKFCVDLLLYKRGPVFQHAEFAIVVIPVYEDPEDKASSPYQLNNAEPFTWSWLSTINRVNAQVQKTLILTYVTIPARSRVDTALLDSPACLAHYSVRDVVLRRFIPARMRD